MPGAEIVKFKRDLATIISTWIGYRVMKLKLRVEALKA
jgi:hypothetical protein